MIESMPIAQVFGLKQRVLFLVMQAGFAFLEAGSVRSKNTTNILIKNTLDLCKYKNRLSLHITYPTDIGADHIHELLKERGEWEKAIAAKPMTQNLNIYKFINIHKIKVLLCFTYQCYDICVTYLYHELFRSDIVTENNATPEQLGNVFSV